MVYSDREIFIAAPSIAEVVRGNTSFRFPPTPKISVVAFDGAAAELLGRKMPEQVLYDIKTNVGSTHGYIKYDAMIVACAARWNTGCIVHLDEKHIPKLAALVELDARTPQSLKSPPPE